MYHQALLVESSENTRHLKSINKTVDDTVVLITSGTFSHCCSAKNKPHEEKRDFTVRMKMESEELQYSWSEQINKKKCVRANTKDSVKNGKEMSSRLKDLRKF